MKNPRTLFLVHAHSVPSEAQNDVVVRALASRTGFGRATRPALSIVKMVFMVAFLPLSMPLRMAFRFKIVGKH
jgi:hypothetical protein